MRDIVIQVVDAVQQTAFAQVVGIGHQTAFAQVVGIDQEVHSLLVN